MKGFLDVLITIGVVLLIVAAIALVPFVMIFGVIAIIALVVYLIIKDRKSIMDDFKNL